MNKKIKIVSTIALTGMMGLNILSSNLYAVNVVSNGKTQVFDASTIGGKKIVPVVLDGKTDTLTRTEIKAKYPEAKDFSGKNQNQVGTGETFKIGNDTYTVMVYGDVNGDGLINSSDALLVERHKTKDTTLTLNSDQKLAADVASRDGQINSSDSLRIKDYAVSNKRTVVDSVPDANKKPEEPVNNYNYDVVVNEGNMVDGKSIINSEKTVLIKATPKEAVTENTTLTVKVLGEDGEEITGHGITLPELKVQDRYTVSDTPVDISSKLGSNKKLTIQVLDTSGKVVGQTEVDVHITLPEVGNVVTNRPGTESAELSLDVLNNGTLKNVKYVVKEGVVASAVATQENQLTESLYAINNKITKASLVYANGYEKSKAYTVSFILVDEYGNKSAIKSAIIASGNAEASETTVNFVTAPTLVDNSNKEFAWKLNGSALNTSKQKLCYTLYKDDVPVKTGDLLSGDFTADMQEVGTYKLGIVIKSKDGTVKDTVEKLSGTVEVKKLNKVSNVEFEVKQENNTNNYVLSWNDDNTSFDSYEVKLYAYNAVTKDFTTDESSKLIIENAKSKTVKINNTVSGMSTNTLYKAKVTVKKEANQYKWLDSDVEASEMFFIIDANGLLSNPVANETSITYELDDIDIEGLDEEVKYQVTVYKMVSDPNDNANYSSQKIDTRDVAISTDEAGQKYLTISNLERNTNYAFRLIAKMGNAEGVATSVMAKATTIKTPEIKGLTVVKNPTVAEAGKVGINGTTLYINGEEIANYDKANYTDEFISNIDNIVAKLKADDVVTIVDNKITLDLKSGVENSTVALTAGTENKILEITGNTFTKTVTVSEKLQELVVNTGLFDISGVSAEKYTLANGTKVSDTTSNKDRDFVIKAGASVRINGVEIEAKKEANILIKNTDIVVKTTKETENDLVFKNESGKDVDIAFVPVGNAGIYTGTVTISSNGGEVVVSQSAVELDNVNLTIDVKSGDIDISNFNGDNLNTTVNVKNNDVTPTTLIVKSNMVAPIDLTDVEIKNYSLEENNVDGITGVNSTNKQNVIDFINSFGFQGTGATLTVDTSSDAQLVTITFPVGANVVNEEVKGLATK
ncbi:MAG: hypothetical protein HFJ45_07755 [Clostridia bacterium]|nr:hypothetical protein [Clostridia bacterium]